MRKKTGWVLLVVTVLCCAAFAGYLFLTWRTEDHTAPEISFRTEELELSVTAEAAVLLEGVSAWDAQDGDVTAGVILEGTSNISSDHTAVATYAAFDRAGNVAKAQRILRYVDYTSPKFTLSQPLVFASGRSMDIMNLIGAEDAIDGVLDDKVKATLVGGEGNLTDVGIHEVEFRVTNSMGETVYLTIPVEVYEAGAYNAVLELRENLVYLEQGDPFDAEAYLLRLQTGSQEILLDSAESNATVQVRSDVNPSVPGTYCVEYTVKSGSFTGHTRLIVVVEEAVYAGE